MLVGVMKAQMFLPGVSSLKEKRHIVKAVIGRLQSRFDVSVSEVEHQDSHTSAVLGMAVVSNERAFIDQTGFGGGFLSEFIAYHGVWYHDLHADPNDPYWNIAEGHIHVSYPVDTAIATMATEETLRVLTDYLDTQIPEPATGLLVLVAVVGLRRRNG